MTTKYNIFILMILVLSLVSSYFIVELIKPTEYELFPSDLSFISEKFYYTNSGKAGTTQDAVWISVNGSVDKGIWTHLGELTFYGTYEWEGYYSGGNDSGWGLQGLVDMHVSKYVAFENLYQENRLRCITYNKSYTTSQLNPETQTTVSKPIDGWHTFKIEWQHSYAKFYLDGELVATHEKDIPIEPLCFHQQVCIAPWMNETSKLVVMMKDIHIRSDYMPIPIE